MREDGGRAAVAPLEARGLEKFYTLGDGRRLHILRGVNLTVATGEAVAVVGQSGSGKSTLLHLLGGLDRPSAGEVFLSGERITQPGEVDPRGGAGSGAGRDALARIRNRRVGFVFQFHHLLREFTAMENAAMPALVAGLPPAEALARARELLEAVGLASRLDHKPWQLSGGEQQRVAVARALVNAPPLLLADEPSGNLDPETSEGLHDLLFRIRAERGLSLVLVTHNRELAARANRILGLRDGVLHDAGREEANRDPARFDDTGLDGAGPDNAGPENAGVDDADPEGSRHESKGGPDDV
jgi:lipoprotein-releasing system ATP-binding protein